MPGNVELTYRSECSRAGQNFQVWIWSSFTGTLLRAASRSKHADGTRCANDHPMRHSILVCAALALFSGLALAEDWTGRLLDASCYDQNKTAKPCDATSTTTAFVLDVNGKIYKLDATGNAKAAEAIKSRADRAE